MVVTDPMKYIKGTESITLSVPFIYFIDLYGGSGVEETVSRILYLCHLSTIQAAIIYLGR
ncbi:MAG: hypothetical protein NVSMB38_00920 [Ktedonobacteraceae bacterium]